MLVKQCWSAFIEVTHFPGYQDDFIVGILRSHRPWTCFHISQTWNIMMHCWVIIHALTFAGRFCVLASGSRLKAPGTCNQLPEELLQHVGHEGQAGVCHLHICFCMYRSRFALSEAYYVAQISSCSAHAMPCVRRAEHRMKTYLFSSRWDPGTVTA